MTNSKMLKNRKHEAQFGPSLVGLSYLELGDGALGVDERDVDTIGAELPC